MAGPPPKLQDTEPFQITVPISLYRYMVWLARNSGWGPTIQDVAVKILTRELEAMYAAGYQDKTRPDPGPMP